MRIVLLFLCLTANAATYYVDFVGGSDSNNGTSTATPFKRIKGMTGCTATCNSTTLAAGDTVVFKGGVTWTASYPWTVGGGSAGGRVTYTTDHSWYSGGAWSQPVFDDQAANPGAVGMAAFFSYTTINDLSWVNCGQSMVAAGAGNSNKCLVFPNTHDISITNNTFSTESWITLYITFDTAGSYSNFTITGNDFSHTSGALWLASSAANTSIHNVAYNNNVFHDFASQIGYDVHGDGALHYYSVPSTDATQYIDTFEFANNYFYGDFRRSAGTTGGMTAFFFTEGSFEGKIYNNVMTFSPVQANMFDALILFGGWANAHTQSYEIYNNTLVNAGVSAMSAGVHGNAPNITLKNNIITGMSFSLYLETESPGYVGDNNVLTETNVFGASFQNPTQWKAAGRDPNSLIGVDPLFVSSPSNVTLQSGSPAIGAGANLSGLGITALNSDKNGVARGSTWDIGAYEYAAPPPPTTLRGTVRGATIK